MDFVIAMWANVSGVFIGAAVLLGLGGLITTIAIFAEGANDEEQGLLFKRLAIRFWTACAVAALLACIPTMDGLWRARIALIKYRLASPENVEKATETIERIGRRLECKYLGGKDCGEEPEKED